LIISLAALPYIYRIYTAPSGNLISEREEDLQGGGKQIPSHTGKAKWNFLGTDAALLDPIKTARPFAM